MWKAIVLSLVLGLLLIPFTASAHDAGVVHATLTISNIFNLRFGSYWDNWGNLTIDQEWISTLFKTPPTELPVDWDATSPNITAEIQSIGEFKIYGSYSTTLETKVGNLEEFIALKDLSTGGTFNDYITYEHVPGLPGPSSPYGSGDHVLDYATVNSNFTYLNWTGNNNLPDGEIRTFDVLWNPLQLTGDFEVNDVMSFIIFFLVTDPIT